MSDRQPAAARPSLVGSALRAILLDYGGTLDGDAQHWLDHFQALYAASGHPLDTATLKPAFYAADAALVANPAVRSFGLTRMVETHVGVQLQHLGLDDPDLGRRLVDAFVADTRRAWDRNRPLLGRLAHRFRLGVVSNSYGNLPSLLAEAGLAPFATVVDSALVGLSKPDPALYTLALQRLGLPAGVVLHVGDSWERDVVPARAVGMHAAWLARAEVATPPAPTSVWRLRSLLELEALLS